MILNKNNIENYSKPDGVLQTAVAVKVHVRHAPGTRVVASW